MHAHVPSHNPITREVKDKCIHSIVHLAKACTIVALGLGDFVALWKLYYTKSLLMVIGIKSEYSHNLDWLVHGSNPQPHPTRKIPNRQWNKKGDKESGIRNLVPKHCRSRQYCVCAFNAEPSKHKNGMIFILVVSSDYIKSLRQYSIIQEIHETKCFLWCHINLDAIPCIYKFGCNPKYILSFAELCFDVFSTGNHCF